MNDPFGLYVHVPWCRQVCPYCDFNVYTSSTMPERAYVDALAVELGTYARDPTWAGRPLRSVYVGGGTPSLFAPATIGELVATADRAFALASDAEVTLEANPGTVSAERLAAYRATGVNRLSLGAQSFESRTLATLGRDHAAADSARAVAAARTAGFDNVSLDLVYAVPGTGLAGWEDDLRAAIDLAPEHVSAYALTYEEGTPFHRWRGSGRLQPVAHDDEAAMAELTVATLEAAGLRRYEISSFARPGRESRHNVSYWDGSDYLGLGAGAHAFTREPAPGRRWMNERLPARYLAAIAADGTAVASEERLTETQARAEFVFTGLRRVAGVDADAFALRFGDDVDAAFPQLADLIHTGLVERAGRRIRLTTRGLAFADEVSARLL
ncbi:MAG TPA: radical SAM family heme chaperone HemW [Candidatus Binatia bacterium]|nr:radical SAM family heme chaperone HemW [Candidatus Binatia bacterium]